MSLVSTSRPVRVLLVATYELGHQPLHLAVPAAALRARGHEVRCLDLSVDPWDPALASWADKVACSVPMHTATRLARDVAREIDRPLCCFGLYAGMCSDVAERTIAGEYVSALVRWVEDGGTGDSLDLGREASAATAAAPARDLLPTLDRYVQLAIGGDRRLVGLVEASHGCAHHCRHCPVPVVYDGRIRIVAEDAVLTDIEQLVVAGARHITFGDPDFLNGVHHACRVVHAMHERFPHLTFDCTTKVEHVLRHADVWPEMAEAGCAFIVSAFESIDDATLLRLDKGHTAADAGRAITLLRRHGIEIRPSFLPFTPWTTPEELPKLLDFVYEHDIVPNVDPVQYTIRLLLPKGSLLLDHPDVVPRLGPYDDALLSYSWTAADPRADALQRELAQLVEAGVARGEPLVETYRRLRLAVGAPVVDLSGVVDDRPRLTESWFCCAEPTSVQLGSLSKRA